MIFFQTFFSLVFFLGSLMACWWLFVNALNFLHPVIVFAFCAALIAQLIYLLRVPLLLLVLGVVNFAKWFGRALLLFCVCLALPVVIPLVCIGAGIYTPLKHPLKSFKIIFLCSDLSFKNFTEFQTHFKDEDESFLRAIYPLIDPPSLYKRNSPFGFLVESGVLKKPKEPKNWEDTGGGEVFDIRTFVTALVALALFFGVLAFVINQLR